LDRPSAFWGRASPADALLIPFSLMWADSRSFGSQRDCRRCPFFFMLWGIPFVLVGFYLIFGRFFVDARQRR